MKRLALVVTIGLAACLTLPAFAQNNRRAPLGVSYASDTLTVPVMVNAGGLAGATFGTYVAIMNPTASSFPVNVTLWDAAGVAYHQTITLAAGELKTYANFLDSVFHFMGAGTVRFQSAGGGTDDLFILNAEVYTSSSGTHYGTSLPSFDTAGSGARSFAAGITVDAHSRVNVGCFNESGAANSIGAKVFDGAGHEVGATTLDLAGHAWGQKGIDAEVSGGYIQFDPSAAADCYAVVVNNGTNDGRLVLAVEYAP